MDLYYCAGGNRRFAETALAAGFGYGVCSNATTYFPPAFLDLDYRRPDFARHLQAVVRWRPRYAVAGDAETAAQLETVLAQAAQLESYATRVIVVPKVTGLVERIPQRYVVGLSVPTSFGGSEAPMWEYRGRQVHLLGGSPQAQMRWWRYLSAEVVSVDGNSHQKAATRWNTLWQNGGWVSKERARALNDLTDTTGSGRDAHHRAFERSCRNIMQAWRDLTGTPPTAAPVSPAERCATSAER